MTVVSINLSQSAATTLNSLRATDSASTLAAGFNVFFVAGTVYGNTHYYYSNASLNGPTLRLDFSDGAYSIYNGVVLANPSATIGTATSTSVTAVIPGYFQLSEQGVLSYQYNGGSFYSTGGTINSASIKTLSASSSAIYNKIVGNVNYNIQGNIGVNTDSNFSGVVTSITSTFDKFIASETIRGSFNISGNVDTIGNGTSSTLVSGTLSSYSQLYRDGSLISVSNGNMPVTGNSILDERVFASAILFPGDDVIDIDLPAIIYQPWVINSGSGNDVVTLKGGGTLLSANLGDGNDNITLKDFGHAIDGNAGIDTLVVTSGISNYSVTKTATGYILGDKTASTGTDTLVNIEAIKFTDKTINLTVQAKAASAPSADVTRLVELYTAFFNRVPDADGMGFWIDEMKAGKTTNQVAEAFYNAGVNYSSLTGFSSTMTNADFINVIYKNVLGRKDGADAGGLSFWETEITSGRATRGTLVTNILDSAHTFKGNATWGWVADLLDNKITVAKKFSIDLGLNYNTPEESITKGMAIASAITPTDTSAAVTLIGVAEANIHLST
jgi:hypothetical protein